MQKTKKRAIRKHLALLLAVVMVLGMLPLSAMATPPLTTADQIVATGSSLYYNATGTTTSMDDSNFVVSTRKTIEPLKKENEFEITL